MSYFRQKRRIVAWLACLAVLLNVLMPAASHALMAEQDSLSAWTAICSASGTTFAPSPFEPPGNENPTAVPMAHCPYCLPHAGSLSLLPAGQALLPLAVAVSSSPLLTYYFSPVPTVPWAIASPRAPPVLA